jgi:hypothetical protein
MDPAEQASEFEKLTARAKRAGLLRGHYPEAGVAILVLPPAPAAATPAAAPPESTPPPAPAAV